MTATLISCVGLKIANSGAVIFIWDFCTENVNVPTLLSFLWLFDHSLSVAPVTEFPGCCFE